METKLIKHGHSYALLKDGKMVAFAHPEDFSNDHMIGKLSLKNCEDIKCGFNLDELAEKRFGKSLHHASNRHSFREGFQMRDKMLGDKKFSEEDVLEISWELFRDNPNIKKFSDFKKCFEEHIQFIEQTEWEVEIEMDMILVGQCDCPCHSDGSTIMHFMACCHPKMVESPKLDADGCLILKRL